MRLTEDIIIYHIFPLLSNYEWECFYNFAVTCKILYIASCKYLAKQSIILVANCHNIKLLHMKEGANILLKNCSIVDTFAASKLCSKYNITYNNCFIVSKGNFQYVDSRPKKPQILSGEYNSIENAREKLSRLKESEYIKFINLLKIRGLKELSCKSIMTGEIFQFAVVRNKLINSANMMLLKYLHVDIIRYNGTVFELINNFKNLELFVIDKLMLWTCDMAGVAWWWNQSPIKYIFVSQFISMLSLRHSRDLQKQLLQEIVYERINEETKKIVFVNEIYKNYIMLDPIHNINKIKIKYISKGKIIEKAKKNPKKTIINKFLTKLFRI